MNKKIVSNLSFIAAAINVLIGFYKMVVYDDDYLNPQNVYVGGDAYNYIINSNYATAFFVLATFFAVLGVGLLIASIIDHGHYEDDDYDEEKEKKLLGMDDIEDDIIGG